MAQRDLVVRFIGDDKDLQRAFASSSRSARQFEGRLAGVGTSVSRAFGAAGIALGAGAFVAATRRAISAASDLEEQMTKNEQVFGDSSKEIVDWSRTAARSMGIAQREALAATGTFGNLFRVIEIAPQQAGAMSRALVQLAADLASFNNASPEDVLVAIRSGLIGEAEPLRRYGVLLSEARVQQVALAETGKTNVKALSDQEKAMARYEIIMRDTATAQGDFARTSDGMANQSRILRAQLSDLSATIGSGLLPFVNNLTRGLNQGIGVVGALGDALNSIGGPGFEAANANFAELVARFEELQNLNASFVPPELERLGQEIREVSTALTEAGATTKLIAGFRQASEEINAALRDGVITPLEAAQLETEELGRLFLTVAPRDVLGGLGASVRSGIEDAVASARVGVQDLAVEVRSGIEDMSRQAVVAARKAGEDTGDAYADGLRAASSRIQGQLSGLGEAALRAQIAGDQGAELAALEAQEANLRRQLEIQEKLVAQGGAGSHTARERIRQDILPELASVIAQQESIRADIARQQERALDKRTVDTKTQIRKQQDLNRSQAELAAERRKGDQFEKLGLTREGRQRTPGVEALSNRLASLREQVKGTFLDTGKTKAEFDRIGKVLAQGPRKVGRDVRQAILEMLNDISAALSGKGAPAKTGGVQTGFVKRGIDDMLKGLGLSPEEEKELRQRFAQLGPGNTGPGRGIAAFGMSFQTPSGTTGGVTPQPLELHIYVDGEEVESRVTRRQQKKRGRTAPSRRGLRPGI